MTILQSTDERLRSIVGVAQIRAADDGADNVGCTVEVSPGNEKEVSSVLAYANEFGLAVIPCGGRTKLGWGNPPKRGDILLSMRRLDRIIEHAWADLTVAVEAGCTMEQLQAALAKQGQRLALDCLWPARATVGGVLSTNDSGVLRLRYGALRDLVIGVTIALADGTLASSGGKVVKNVAGYDLPKLVTGALGTLGVITRAIFRTHPVCRESVSLSFGASDAEAMQTKIMAIENSQLAHTALQIRASHDGKIEADVLFEGRAAGLLAQERHLQTVLGTAHVVRSDAGYWRAAEQLWNTADQDCLLAKLIGLPTMLAATLRNLEQARKVSGLAWRSVLQATGIGWIRLDGAVHAVQAGVAALRAYAEANGGSFTVLRRPAGLAGLDCWGTVGDSILLMRALKQQFDPRGTINRGRFLGGI